MTDQPHRAARVEARLHGVLEDTLLGRGWVPRVVPHVGYGTTTWVRVLARVLLAPPGGPRPDREGPGVPSDLRGWRRFVSTSAVGEPVTVTVDGRAHEVTSDRDGYVDVQVPASLEPGWHRVAMRTGDAPEASASVRVVGPGTRLGLVSDIDDTVIVTMLPRPLVAFRNAFLLRESARTPVPGMAELYAEVGRAHPDVFVAYLSTGAWNTAGALARFLHHHGYPPGPLLLTDWGPTPTGWFRSGAEHKHAQLRRLLAELPDLAWLLVGDDGQHDPTIYADVAAEHPDRVAGIAIRELSLGEQVVGHGTAVARDETPAGPAAGLEVRAPDGFGLRDALRERGLLP
ncbi:phosphatase domain-containing protein [Nocardioides sp.]|uniref:App1 family protein n=1 Tax=Nocardioides sp. TaxID=35761 RepID=UPI0025F7B588|nr:phosphatase domain-containing protein [Nocardioides sp.]